MVKKSAPRKNNIALVEIKSVGRAQDTLSSGGLSQNYMLVFFGSPLYLNNGFGHHISLVKVFSI
jgi:hypothetical protein